MKRKQPNLYDDGWMVSRESSVVHNWVRHDDDMNFVAACGYTEHRAHISEDSILGRRKCKRCINVGKLVKDA